MKKKEKKPHMVSKREMQKNKKQNGHKWPQNARGEKANVKWPHMASKFERGEKTN